MKQRQPLTADRLRDVLSYDASSGVFTWVKPTSNRAPAGSVAGCKHKVDGRIYINVDGRLYKAHRLAWLYAYGSWPTQGIDHIDGRPDNNRLSNLREATQHQNMQNLRRANKRSSSGLLGAYKARGGKFSAQISVHGRRTHLGTFGTAGEAHAAYLSAKASLHPFSTITRKEA